MGIITCHISSRTIPVSWWSLKLNFASILTSLLTEEFNFQTSLDCPSDRSRSGFKTEGKIQKLKSRKTHFFISKEWSGKEKRRENQSSRRFMKNNKRSFSVHLLRKLNKKITRKHFIESFSTHKAIRHVFLSFFCTPLFFDKNQEMELLDDLFEDYLTPLCDVFVGFIPQGLVSKLIFA